MLNRTAVRLLPVAFALMLSACATVGSHNAEHLDALDFGQSEELRICVLADESVTEDDARRLMAGVGEEFSKFGLEITVPWVERWKRPAFLSEGIVVDVWLRTLDSPCDRLLALVGRHFGDFLFGLLGAEVLGAVDTVTYTRGYVVAETGSLNQLLVRPSETAIHESYHLMGCAHQLSLSDCYKHIQNLKKLAARNRGSGVDFFPSISPKGTAILSRQEADALVHGRVRKIQQANNAKR